MSLDTIVLVKPKAYESMGKDATEEMVKADQRGTSAIKEKIITKGEEQLKAKTGFTIKNLPDESPLPTSLFTLDEIKFYLETYVGVKNPEYQPAFNKITGFLEVLVNDWKQGIRKDNVRTYDAEFIEGDKKTYKKAPFVEWKYLMWNVLWYVSRVTDVNVTNQIKGITAPAELNKMDLERLVIPTELIEDFNIDKPGAAKTWYLARRFYNEVMEETVEPVKAEMEERTGVTVEEMPEKTEEYSEQFEKLLYTVSSTPSPRRLPGQAINRLFKIPQKGKQKGSTALPIVPGPEDIPEKLIKDYLKLLEEYRDILPTSLKKWKTKEGKLNYDGKIGELIVFYYGLENDSRIQEQFPFLPEYQIQKDKNKMFVYIQALYDGMKALEKDYKKNRLLRKHRIVSII